MYLTSRPLAELVGTHDPSASTASRSVRKNPMLAPGPAVAWFNRRDLSKYAMVGKRPTSKVPARWAGRSDAAVSAVTRTRPNLRIMPPWGGPASPNIGMSLGKYPHYLLS